MQNKSATKFTAAEKKEYVALASKYLCSAEISHYNLDLLRDRDRLVKAIVAQSPWLLESKLIALAAANGSTCLYEVKALAYALGKDRFEEMVRAYDAQIGRAHV